jgi:poly-beta-1,6-N-acetyl-D-glucosamine synthase
MTAVFVELIRIIFVVSIAVLVYTYLGYGLLLWVVAAVKQKIFHAKFDSNLFHPSVALVVAAYNEETCIREKIRNSLELVYDGNLEIVFITDGSNDNTASIVREYSEITHLHDPRRKGKTSALNRALPFIKSDYIIFSDANCLLNSDCILQIIKHFQNPRVGGVAGEKRIIFDPNEKVSQGENLYWRYESFLKKLDGYIYTAVGAAGELFAMRKELYTILPEDIILEDFYQSLQICLKGYIVAYEPNAYAIETASISLAEEMKRKSRICAGAFQAMSSMPQLFNFFRYPTLAFQFISHRALRWTICPIAIVLLFATNLVLVIYNPTPVYVVIMSLQLLFYLMAVVGWRLSRGNKKMRIFNVPLYFSFMNLAAFKGFYLFVKGRQSVLWEKVERRNFAS